MKKGIFIGLVFFSFVVHSYSQNISTVAGTGVAGYSGDNGQATLAQINLPACLVFDTAGNLLFGDENDRIRKIDQSGIIVTIVGNGMSGFSGDGGTAISAKIDSPYGIAVDDTSNLYFSSPSSLPGKVRKVDVFNTINTVVGICSSGLGDGGLAYNACINNPLGIAFDKKGNMYVSDANDYRIRKISTSGIITTIAGNGTAGFSGDTGPATSAHLNFPYGIVVDSIGNVFFSDNQNSRIRKIDTFGIITTIVGIGISGFSGDNGPAISAKINNPAGLTLDLWGNIYIADRDNSRIRKVDGNGIISTIAGTGIANYNGDGIPATSAQLSYPTDLRFDKYGNLYITDYNNNRIRKIDNIASEQLNPGKWVNISVYPNPSTNNIIVKSIIELYSIKICDVFGQFVLETNCKTKEEQIDISTLQNGVYFVKVSTKEGTITKKIVVQR